MPNSEIQHSGTTLNPLLPLAVLSFSFWLSYSAYDAVFQVDPQTFCRGALSPSAYTSGAPAFLNIGGSPRSCMQWDFLSSWDDNSNFLQNDMILELSLKNARNWLSLVKINVYEPLGWFLKAVVVNLDGGRLDSLSCRRATSALHAANTLLLTVAQLHLISLLRSFQFPFSRSSPPLPSSASPRPDPTLISSFVPLLLPLDVHLGLTPAALLAALGAAVLWALHPVHAEVVAWPSAQPYALCGTFMLLAVIKHLVSFRTFFTQTMTAAATTPPRPRFTTLVWHGTGTAVLYVMSVMSKSACVASPLALILLDGALHSHRLRPSSRKMSTLPRNHPATVGLDDLLSFLGLHIPSLLCMTLIVFVTLAANKSGSDPFADSISLPSNPFSPSRFFRALQTMHTYLLSKAIDPVDLRPHYAVDEGSIDIGRNATLRFRGMAFAGILVTATTLYLSALCSTFGRRRAPPDNEFSAAQTAPTSGRRLGMFRDAVLLCGSTSLLCAVSLFLPTCGLVQHGMIQAGGDRYAYLPYLPLAGGIGVGIWAALERGGEGESEVRGNRDEKGSGSANAHVPAVSACRNTNISFYSLLLLLPLFLSHLLGFRALAMSQACVWCSDLTLHRHGLYLDLSDWRVVDVHLENLLSVRAARDDGAAAADGRSDEEDKDRLDAEFYRFLSLSDLLSPRNSVKASLLRAKNYVLAGDLSSACNLYEGLGWTTGKHQLPSMVGNNLALCTLRDFARNGKKQGVEILEQAVELCEGGNGATDTCRKIKNNLQKLHEYKGDGPFHGSLIY